MSKRHRQGRGKQAKSSKNSGKSPRGSDRGASDQKSARGREDEGPSVDRSRSKKAGPRTDSDASENRRGGSDRRKGKDIKNARSLSDVIGGGRGPRPSSGGGGGPKQRQTHFEPGSRDQTREGGPKPSKLTYITNFQPPGAPPAQTSRPAPAESTPRRASGPATSESTARRATSAPTETRRAPTPAARTPQASGKWPQNRIGLTTPQQEVETETRQSVSPRAGSERITGMVKRHPDGFGFLIADDRDYPDVYISRQSMTGIMSNDKVEVQVYKPKTQRARKTVPSRDDRLAGEITRVIAHANKRVVGKFLPVDQKYGVIQDENRGWGTDLRILTKDAMGAKEGDLIVVEVLQYPNDNREFTGKVVGLLGDVEDPMNDIIRVAHQAGIPMEFSKEALAEAKKYPHDVTEAEKKGREDLRDFPLITIDGATARDFDDAVFVQQDEKGFNLIVAIADVSHYVKPGTPLDQDAYDRGTSTYFPNFVIPMLPEELSNELCSLKPNVDRLCFCCAMQIDFQGVVRDYRFFEGVMNSKARVIYGEAQEVLDGKTPPRLQHVAENIRMAGDLAKLLMAKRFREGSLDLEIPETQVVVDSSGQTVDIIRSQRLFAHRLIEELMLVTNICTARFMDENEIPGIYRIHEEPDPDNIMALQRYLWNLGGERMAQSGRLQKKLTAALQAMEGKPGAGVLNILTLRTMRQAQYSEQNVGHFGLGFSHYSHFTSPIRRYPDLIAHRLIKAKLYKKYESMQMTEDELASATTFLSGCEQRSTKADRNVISIKKARFIRKFIGDEFDGIISSVTKFGVFVLLRQYDVDGLVKIENLGPDRFVFDDENLRLVGQKSDIVYTIGDEVRVRVNAADPETGRVDFALAEMPEFNARDPLNTEDDELLRESHKAIRGAKKKTGRKAEGTKDGAREQGRSKKGKRVDPQKRGKTENDSRGVRKERVSKRRGKN